MRKYEHLFTEHIMLIPHRCKGCWSCIDECPRQVIGKVRFFSHKHAHINNTTACIGCGKCVKVCRSNAIENRDVINQVNPVMGTPGRGLMDIPQILLRFNYLIAG